MAEKTLQVKNESGLHARPASEFVKITAKYGCDITLEKGEKSFNAKSILGVLALGIAQGDMIKIVTSGDDEEPALKELVEYMENLSE